MIRSADILVFLDDVQFTRRDWRNRNLIKNEDKNTWLTIPLVNSGNYQAQICEMRVSDPKWWLRHLAIFHSAYGSFRPYQALKVEIHDALKSAGRFEFLTEINHFLCKSIFDLLQINTQIYDSRIFPSAKVKTERLVEICVALNATEYVSGPAAKSYLDVDKFNEVGIEVRWVDYSLLNEKPSGSTSTDGLSILHDLAVFGLDECRKLSTFQQGTDT